jgi:subtilisin family serine protease
VGGDVTRRRTAAALVAAAALLFAAARPAAATPGPSGAPEYWFDSWRIESLWAQGARGQGITIAEIDTGVNAALPELRGRVLSGADFGKRGNGQIDRERDEFGHGTAMASIMVARPGLLDITGMAPDAKILPIAVPLDGTTTESRSDQVPRAIRYAADHHADIISMSLGGERTPGVDREPCGDAEQSAIFYALRKGALVVAAVGNTGPAANTIEDPGVCLGVLSVGAVDATGTVAGFSARQPYLSLVAPGVNIPSLGRVPGQAYSGSGTSQATAITSATAALVWSAHPDLGARGVATRILATLDAHRSSPDPAYGYGLLDAYRAVTANVAANTPNPVYDAVRPFMSRVDALATPVARPPRAARGPIAAGPYRVGSVPRLTPEVGAGTGMAAYGLSLLIVVLVVGLQARARRRRVVARPAGYAPSGRSGPEWPVVTAHSGPNGPLDGGVPHPRPGPGAIPGASPGVAGPPDSAR